MGKQKGKHVLGKLSAVRIAKEKTPGYYADGGNLWLRVSASGSKSWTFVYTVNGRTREMGLGGLHKVSLERARQKATQERAKLGDGVDPIDVRQSARDQASTVVARRVTFSEAAKRYIAAHSPTWSNEKHAAQWTATLETYAAPWIGSLPVAAVDTTLIMKVLEPIWTTKTETATRVRQRVENVLDWATTQGLRDGANPARWKGHLDNLLPKPGKIAGAAVVHHRALPFEGVPQFMIDLRQQQGVAARALEFTVLTACRSNEVLGARWEEIDLENDLWVIPAGRMKMKKEHRVPLNVRAGELLLIMKKLTDGTGFVFPGMKAGRPLSNMAMTTVLRRMKVDAVPHGFRSSFRDWASEKTTYQKEVCEMSLAHAIGDKVEAAYRRGDLFDKRRKLMHAWCDFANVQEIAKPATVTPITARIA